MPGKARPAEGPDLLRRAFIAIIPVLCLLLAAETAPPSQAGKPRSVITVRAYKAGLFSAFAHNHTIQAPIARAMLDPQTLTAEIMVAVPQMKVIDPEDSESTRAEIQATMLGPKVLDAQKYPEVRFKSTRIEPVGQQRYKVTGLLELHGVSRSISFEVTGGPDLYHGGVKLSQSDFGIKPVSVAGGTIKVKDQLDLEFDVDAREFAGK